MIFWAQSDATDAIINQILNIQYGWIYTCQPANKAVLPVFYSDVTDKSDKCFPADDVATCVSHSSSQICVNNIFGQHIHNGVTTWKRFPHCRVFCEWNPPITDGFPSHKVCNAELGSLICCQSASVVEQTVDLSVMCAAMKLIWRHCNDRMIRCENKILVINISFPLAYR